MQTPNPIPADCEHLAVVVRLETALALAKLAEKKGFPNAEELLAEVARIIAGRVELTPNDLRAIADALESKQPVVPHTKPAPQTRSSLARVVQVVRLLVTGKHNTATIAETLECATKTVQRDLDFVRDRLGIRVIYDAASQSLRADGVDFREAVGNVAALGLLAGVSGVEGAR